MYSYLITGWYIVALIGSAQVMIYVSHARIQDVAKVTYYVHEIGAIYKNVSRFVNQQI